MEMVELTPGDSEALSRLVRFPNHREILDQIQSRDAREVGEAFLDEQAYSAAPPIVRATVDHLKLWKETNRRLAEERAGRLAAR
jgi:hypothetical protein